MRNILSRLIDVEAMENSFESDKHDDKLSISMD